MTNDLLDLFFDAAEDVVGASRVEAAIDDVRRGNLEWLYESSHARDEALKEWADNNIDISKVCDVILEDYDEDDYDQVLAKLEAAEKRAIEQEALKSMQRAEDEYQRSIEEPNSL